MVVILHARSDVVAGQVSNMARHCSRNEPANGAVDWRMAVHEAARQCGPDPLNDRSVPTSAARI